MAIDYDHGIGAEPGLRFALLSLPGKGVVSLGWKEIQAWKPADGFLWVHLERDAPEAQAWIQGAAGLDPLVALALLAEDSRPRVEDVDDNLLVVLRGVNRFHSETRDDRDVATQLVPVHIWMEAGRCISLRDKAHSLTALRNLRTTMMAGKGPTSAGGLMARIAEMVTEHVGALVDEEEEAVSQLEDRLGDGAAASAMRVEIAQARRRVVQFRRYLGPQRDALYRLRQDDASWLDAKAQDRLREVNDRLNGHLEDLDEIRQRATILQEELRTRVAEETNRNTFAMSVVSVIMLPMTFVTGFFGMNTGRLPFSGDHPYGTMIATAIIVGTGIITGLLLLYGMRRR